MKRFVLPILALACALPARAQEDDENKIPVYVEEDDAGPLLDQAEAFEKRGEWDLAIEKYQKVLKEHPDEVRKVDKEGRTWKSVRRLIFERIAKFPPEGRKRYLERNDAMAKSLFDEAVKERSLTGIEKVAHDYFFTSVGDDASARLAEFHAERGRLSDAAYYWERVLTLYPDSDLPLADMAARWGAASRRGGDREGWEAAREKLVSLGDAKLRLNGKEMTAREAAAALERVRPGELRAERADEWPRLGGNNSGSRITTATSRNDIPLWSFPDWTPEKAVQHRTQARAQTRGAQGNGQFLHCYPSVSGGSVIVADGARVFFVDLETGELDTTYPATEAATRAAAIDQIFLGTMLGQPRILSMVAPVVADGVAYVNFLPSNVQWQANAEGLTYLAAIDMNLGNRLLWTTKDEPRLADVWFGSPPVVYGGRVYAPVALSNGGQDQQVELVVLDARTGALLHRIFLCAGTRANNPWGGWGMSMQEAPMAGEAGGVVYVCTNVGAVAAVHGCTGEILWLTAYADPAAAGNRRVQRNPEQARTGRGLNPVVVTGNRVCCMPGDATSYFEFDTRTGTRLASFNFAVKTSDQTPQHFLGVRRNRAWFAGKSLYFTLNVDIEWRDRENPLTVISYYKLTKGDDGGGSASALPPGQSTLPRGFLTQDSFYVADARNLRVYHPDSVKLLESADWDISRKNADFGHLLVVGDRLLCFSEAGVMCFTSREAFDRRFADMLASDKPDPVELEKHAEVLARNPRTWAGAVKDYERLAAMDDPVRAKRAQQRVAQLRKALGDQARAKQDFAGAIEHYKKAADSSPDGETAGQVYQLMGECYEKLQQWGEAVKVYQEVLLDHGDRVVTLANGLTQPIRQFAEEKIAALVKDHGEEIYRDIEEGAKQLFEELKKGDAIEELKKWWDRYPNSSLVGPAAFEIASKEEARGKPAEAAATLLLLVDRAPGLREAPQALARAAELLSASGEWERASETLARLERRFPGARVEAIGRAGTSEEIASAIRALAPPEPAPEMKPPALWRVYTADAADEEAASRPELAALGLVPEFVVPQGRWKGLDPERVVLMTRMSVLEARDAKEDRLLWSAIDGRGWLGVDWMQGEDGETLAFGAVTPDSPLDQAGGRKGDILVAIDGVRLEDVMHARRMIGERGGRKTTLEVLRAEKAGAPRTKLSLQATMGRRERLNKQNHAVKSAFFLDCGLLVVVRTLSVEALDPATGEIAWLHYPMHGRDVKIERTACADDRVFLVWAPDREVVPPGTPGVTLEALDGRTGRRLWHFKDKDFATVDVAAAPGTGRVVRCTRSTAGAQLEVLDAHSGQERARMQVLTTADGRRQIWGVSDGRLYAMRDAGSISVIDLHDLQAATRDLGAVREAPAFLVLARTHAVLGYTQGRLSLLPLDAAQAPAIRVNMPTGFGVVEDRVWIDDARLYAQIRPESLPDVRLVRYDLSEGVPRDLREQILPLSPVAAGPGAPGHVLIAGVSRNQGLEVRCLEDRRWRLVWMVQEAAVEGAGGFRAAGLQGRTVWVQWEGRLALYR